MCLYAISFTVFEADLQIYWLPVLLFFTVTSIIMFFVFMDNISVLIEIFQYKALFCLLLAFLDGVLHTVKYIFCVLFSRLLFFLSGGYYSVVLV